MSSADTNDDLIARCQRRVEKVLAGDSAFVSTNYVADVPALIAALTAAQVEIERLSAIADIEKATSFKLRQELSDTLAELHRLRAKVKQGDALAAALRRLSSAEAFDVATADVMPEVWMRIDYARAALAAWEDTPSDSSGGV